MVKKYVLIASVLFITHFSQAATDTFDISSTHLDLLAPAAVLNNPIVKTQLEAELQKYPDGIVAKNYKVLSKTIELFEKDIRENPEKWNNPQDWSTTYEAQERVSAFATASNVELVDYAATYSFREIMYNNPSLFNELQAGGVQITEHLPDFAQFLYKEGGNYLTSHRSFKWSFLFPISIGGTIYKASLISSPKLVGLKSNDGKTPDLYKAKLSIYDLDPKHRNAAEALVINNPFLLAHSAQRDSEAGSNDKETLCFDSSNKHPLTAATVHANVKDIASFRACLKPTAPYVSKIKLKYLGKEKDPSTIYPEFDQLFSAEKKHVDLMILSSNASGFGISNFLKLIRKYTNDFSTASHHGGGNKNDGDFKKIFESNNSVISINNEAFSPKGTRYVVLESDPIADGKTFRIHLVYHEYDYDKIFKEMAPSMDMIVYQGHSGYGGNFSAFTDIPYQRKKYQQLFILACSSFDYVSLNFSVAKSMVDFDLTGYYWDFIGSQRSAPLWQSEETLEAYINFFFDAFLDYYEGQSLKQYSYGLLMKTLNEIDNNKAQWKAAGIQENRWTPSSPTTEAVQQTEKELIEVLQYGFQLLLTNQSPGTSETIINRMKDSHIVPKGTLNSAFDEFSDNSILNTSDVEELRLRLFE